MAAPRSKSASLQKGIIPPSRQGTFYLCTTLLALAMGMQTATLQKIGGQAIRTTFVTGVLSDLIHNFVDYLFWLHAQSTKGQLPQALQQSNEQAAFRRLGMLTGLWGCYILGATCASALEQRFSLTALVFPLGVLALLIAIDIVRPFDTPSRSS